MKFKRTFPPFDDRDFMDAAHIIDTHGDDDVCMYVSEPPSEPNGDDFTDAFPLKTIELSTTYNAIVLYR